MWPSPMIAVFAGLPYASASRPVGACRASPARCRDEPSGNKVRTPLTKGSRVDSLDHRHHCRCVADSWLLWSGAFLQVAAHAPSANDSGRLHRRSRRRCGGAHRRPPCVDLPPTSRRQTSLTGRGPLRCWRLRTKLPVSTSAPDFSDPSPATAVRAKRRGDGMPREAAPLGAWGQ